MTSQELARDWLTLIEAEFQEMPGLRLTECQMRRLWGLDAVTCTVIIDTLVDAGVLRETPKHQFALAAARRIGRNQRSVSRPIPGSDEVRVSTASCGTYRSNSATAPTD